MPATQFNLIGNGNLQMGVDMDHHPVRSFAVFGTGGLNSKIALTAAGWSLPVEYSLNSQKYSAHCGVTCLCVHGIETLGFLEATLPDYDGMAIVHWGKPHSGSNARMIVGGNIVEELSGAAVNQVTTRVAFDANAKIRFEEDHSIVSVYSIDIEGTVWCADGPTWFNKSTSFATFGNGGINDESALSAAGWAKSSSDVVINNAWSMSQNLGCGGSFACFYDDRTHDPIGYIEKALPNFDGIATVRWGTGYRWSNGEGCELRVGGKLIHTAVTVSDTNDNVTTIVPFKAGDMLQFNETGTDVCAIHSVSLQRRLFGCPPESSVPAGKGYTLDTVQAGPPNALDYSGYALTFQGKTTNGNNNGCC